MQLLSALAAVSSHARAHARAYARAYARVHLHAHMRTYACTRTHARVHGRKTASGVAGGVDARGARLEMDALPAFVHLLSVFGIWSLFWSWIGQWKRALMIDRTRTSMPLQRRCFSSSGRLALRCCSAL
eukprot:5361036-Pleurochrysis_carterae.AAC.5